MTLRRKLKACLSSAGLPSFSFHRFRHSDASLLFALGVDPDDIALYLGHADSEITKRIYIHDTTERRKRIASLLDGLVKELRTLDQGSKTGSKA